MLSSFWIKHAVCSSDAFRCQLLHFPQYLTLKVNLRRYVAIQILLKFLIGYLIALLILAIILPVLLHCIISEMCEQILGVFDVVLTGSGSDVAICIPVTLHFAVMAADGHIVTDIELPLLVQQRLLDVFLHDEGAIRAV